MPLDSTNFGRVSEPSLAELARLLRHPEEWPPGFRWYYPHASSCAAGLARAQWPRTSVTAGDRLSAYLQGFLHIPSQIYFSVRPDGWRRMLGPFGVFYVTPIEVADAIDRHLERVRVHA